MRHGIRQGDLAELIGYEQSYVSALEVGIKGPPPPEFLERLIQGLALSSDEQEKLRTAAAASQRKLIIDHDTPQEVYLLLADLRERLPTLHPAQVRMLREILGIRSILSENQPESITRLKRRRKEEARM